MGTVIDCFVPKQKEHSIEELHKKLRQVYFECMLEYESLEKLGNYSESFHGDWHFELVAGTQETASYISGEGGSFFIDIYENIVHICCLERFSNLYLEFSPISRALFLIFKEICKTFTLENASMILAIGGNGETDEIMEAVISKDVEMQDVIQMLEALFSDPAKNTADLIEKNWLLTTL